MIYKRYKDADKLIVDADGLKLSDDALVLIYHEDKWYDDVLIDLEGQAVSFEKLKPYIIFAAKNLAEMDVIAQKYSALHGDGRFVDGYEVTYVFLDDLLSHTVSSAVPSAAEVLTIVFGMGTGVSPQRIATRSFSFFSEHS